MNQLNNKITYPLSDLKPKEDELAFAKGCISGLLMAAPIWFIIVMIIKWIVSH